jgi:hypothetical protein
MKILQMIKEELCQLGKTLHCQFNAFSNQQQQTILADDMPAAGINIDGKNPKKNETAKNIKKGGTKVMD